MRVDHTVWPLILRQRARERPDFLEIRPLLARHGSMYILLGSGLSEWLALSPGRRVGTQPARSRKQIASDLFLPNLLIDLCILSDEPESCCLPSSTSLIRGTPTWPSFIYI